jgi:plastocyanin
VIRNLLVYSFFLFSLTYLLQACGGNSTSVLRSSGTPTSNATNIDIRGIRIVARDNVFEPRTYVAQGPAFRISMSNEGSNIHEVEVEGLVPETRLAPGQSKSLDVADVKAGTYRIYCEIHEDERMEGELIVK